MSWNRLFRHDLHRGILCVRQIIPFVQFLLISLFFWLGVRNAVERITFGDFLFHLFGGMPVLTGIQNNTFRLPTIWLQIFACPLYLNLSYPLNDLTKEGEQILIRCGSRKHWILSKYAWNFCASAVYFLSALAAALCITLAAGGKLTLACSPALTSLLSYMPMQPVITPLGEAAALLILPLLTIASLNMLQMTLSFLIRPVYGFLICMAVLIVSVFLPSPCILGNGAMLLRSELFFIGDAQVSASASGMTALLTMLLCVPAGILKFKTFDILPSQEKE